MNNHPEIQGWGADSDPTSRPAVPRERTPPRFVNPPYVRPEQQPQRIPVLISNERGGVITPVFGTDVPPAGVSGLMRKLAFRYSEGDLRHWLILLAADRVNVVEGIVDDFIHLRPPNIFKEMGWKAELRHRPVRGALKIGVTASVLGLVLFKLFAPKPKPSFFQNILGR